MSKIYKVKDWKTDKAFYVKEYDLYYFKIRGTRYSIYSGWL